MIDEIQSLLNDYQAWLLDNTSLRNVEDSVEITTPYMDRHNDHMQIYAKKTAGGYLLTDDGYILDDLEQSGVPVEKGQRLALLGLTLGGFGVRRVDNELQVRATSQDFAQRKHNLLQAMLAVNDLFYLAQPIVENLFFEEVILWLNDADVRYVSNAKYTGTSGYEHLFQFSIPPSVAQPERLVRTVNKPTKEQAQITAFSWVDIREVRPVGSQAYAILNDLDRNVPGNVMEAMLSYEVKPILWSKRDEIREELAA